MSAMAKHGKPEEPTDSPAYMFKLIGSIGLILLGGLFAGEWKRQWSDACENDSHLIFLPFLGLTLALMGSDDMQLRVLATSSEDPKERKHAASVLRLLKRGRHWVLVVSRASHHVIHG